LALFDFHYRAHRPPPPGGHYVYNLLHITAMRREKIRTETQAIRCRSPPVGVRTGS